MKSTPARPAFAIPAIVVAISASLAAVQPAPRLLGSAFYDSSSPGISLGSSLQEVRDLFGTLPDENDGHSWAIDGNGVESTGDAKLLNYQGFMVTLERPTGSDDYTTIGISVTEPNHWVTPGLAVGMRGRVLRALLGEPELTAIDGGSGGKIWHYSIDPCGDLRISLRHDVVTFIELGARP